MEKINTLVIGAGQAGLALSEHLSNNGIQHMLLERSRIAESWRTARWDSLVANGPAWHDRFPTMEFEGEPPDSFPSRDRVVKYFEDFAKQVSAPVRCGVEVTRVSKNSKGPGFVINFREVKGVSDTVSCSGVDIDSSRKVASNGNGVGEIEALHVVCATGPFQTPVIPPVLPATLEDELCVKQMHSNEYRNPQQLKKGSVLVVGAGSSGGQIADELLRSGRRVFLSVGPHERPPRSYRGRDFVWWLGVLGKWDLSTVDPDTAHVTISVSGARGGHTVDFREYAARGMNLLGMTSGYRDGVLEFADDLNDTINNGDASYLAMLDEADAYVERNALDLPLEPNARTISADPECMINPILQLNLQEENISTIIWATGYRNDFSWLECDVLDDQGKPVHSRGVSGEPGIYFLGLPWLSRRGSSFIWGVWHDAKYIADHIGTQHEYMAYHLSRQREQ